MATVHAQVLLVLRWPRHRADLHAQPAGTQVGDATAYRNLHEALDVIADHASDLHHVVADARPRGRLPGPGRHPARTDRVAPAPRAGHHLWHSGKHHAFGDSLQVLSDPTAFPRWVWAVRPGSTHDLTAARHLVLPTLYPHAARGLPVLTDKGCIGTGIGGHTPVRQPVGGALLHTNIRTYNGLLTDLWYRANAHMRCSDTGARWTAR